MSHKLFELDVRLRGIEPPIWRTIEVPGASSLEDVHFAIQVAMGWTNSHLHEFVVEGAHYAVPDPDWGLDEVIDESGVKLSRIAGEGSRLRYAYDFGDGWQHDVLVEKVLGRQPGLRYPCCVAGRRACPPEDVGGPWGYQDFLAAVSDPGHAEHEQWLEWAGGGFDPAEFDLVAVDKALNAFAWVGSPLRPVH